MPACIDGKGRRTTPEGIAVLQHLLRAKALRDDATVVMALGANDSGKPAGWGTCQATTTLAAAGKARAVLWVNAFAEASPLTRQRSRQFNTEIDDLAGTVTRLTVADWHAYVEANPDVMSSDRVHPTEPGQADWARFVSQAIVTRTPVDEPGASVAPSCSSTAPTRAVPPR